MDNAMMVEVVNGIKNRADENNSIVLCKLALCKDVVKELSNSGKFKREIVLWTQSPHKT